MTAIPSAVGARSQPELATIGGGQAKTKAAGKEATKVGGARLTTRLPAMTRIRQ